MHYTVIRYYSIVTGGRAVRLSSWDDQHREYWAVVPQEYPGRGNREAKERALDAISDAITQGHDPGMICL